MPNYSLVANTQFKARNFDDLIRPYAMYTQEYRTQENAIADLATKADIWAGLANEQTDPIAYAQYTNYANALKDQAAIIADRGLDPSSRQAILNLKRRYSSEITPIEQAYTTRKIQAEEQRKALLQNPTLIMSRRADATSLDRYIENPNLGYESYSGALLTQQTGQVAAAIAKELRNYGKGKPLDGFTRTWLQQHGYTAAEVAFAINHPNDPRASSVLNTIVNNVIADSGIVNWADNKTLNQAYNYARQGLWQAVGQTQIGTYTDQAAVMAEQEAMQQRAGIKAMEAATQLSKGFGLNPTNIYSQRELSEAEKKYKENVENFEDYFYKDKNGNITMTWAGRKEYYNTFYEYPKYTQASPFAKQPKGHYRNTPFRIFMDNLGAGKYMSKSIEDNTTKALINVGNLWVNYRDKSPGAKTAKYDAQKDTEYTIFIPQTKEYQDDFKGKLKGIAGSTNELVEVDYDPNTRKWVTTGNTLSLSNFYKDDYKIISRNPSTISDKNGNMTTWKIAKDGESAKRYMSIPGIHGTSEAGRNEAAISMWQTQQLLMDPNLSQSDRKKLEDAYDNWAQQLYMLEMQLDITNKTSDQNVSPYPIP